MDTYIKEIIDRYYSNEYIKEKLYIIIPKIIEYFGENNLNIIIEAIRSIDIYLCPFEKEMVRFIDNRLNLQINNYGNNYLNRNLINSSSGISYSITADIEYDADNEVFVNKGRNRKIIFIKEISKYANNSNKNSEEHIVKTLIHEFIVQIKNISKNNIIRNGKRITRNGVQQTYSLINKNNDLITLDFLSESGKGFNMAMCEYDTLMIFANIFGYEPTTCAYPLEVEILKKIIKDKTILDVIHSHEIDGDIPKLRNIFDTTFYDGAFDKTIALFDKIIQFPYRDNEALYDKLKSEAQRLISSLIVNNEPTTKKIY